MSVKYFIARVSNFNQSFQCVIAVVFFMRFMNIYNVEMFCVFAIQF